MLPKLVVQDSHKKKLNFADSAEPHVMPNACRTREVERGKRTSRTHRLYQGGISLARQASAAATRRYTMPTGPDEGVAAWRRFCSSLREPQAHGTWFTTANPAQASTLSLPAYAQLTRPVHAFPYQEMRVILAQHSTPSIATPKWPRQGPGAPTTNLHPQGPGSPTTNLRTCIAGPRAFKSRKSGASVGLGSPNGLVAPR